MGGNGRALLRAMRLPFLVLTPVCVLLGASVVVAGGAAWAWADLVLALLGGVLAHISVNTLNEYEDFQSGLDHHTQRTPFSGGSGALIDCPQAAGLVRGAGIATLAATVAIGVYFVQRWGAALMPLGAVGVILIVTYTQWLNRWPLACLIAPGLAFGPLMVVGTAFVLTGEFSTRAALVSLVPFFLVNNLLLLNQLPDIEADRRVGRRHVPIAYGVRTSLVVYLSFALAAALVIVVGAAAGQLSMLSVVAAVPLLATVRVGRTLWGAGSEVGSAVTALGANVGIVLAVPALLGVAIAVPL